MFCSAQNLASEWTTYRAPSPRRGGKFPYLDLDYSGPCRALLIRASTLETRVLFCFHHDNVVIVYFVRFSFNTCSTGEILFVHKLYKTGHGIYGGGIIYGYQIKKYEYTGR